MAPTRKHSSPTLKDIPLLEDVVEPDSPVAEPAVEPESAESARPVNGNDAAPVPAPVESIPLDILSEVLTERITALTDRLLRDASAEIHATLVNKVWEKLREEIPALVDEAIRENGGDN